MLASQGPCRCPRRHHQPPLTAAAAAAGRRACAQPQQQRRQQRPRRRPGAAPPAAAAAAGGAARAAGPDTPPPDYLAIDRQPLNSAVMALFRRKMVAAIGEDSQLSGYEAIIDLTRRLNTKFSEARQVQLATRGILNSLFPSWLPGAFKVMFSGPLPDFSYRLNALATALTCQWLMGPCKVNDVEVDGGRVGQGMGVLVERCRYLEQSGCASICLNSCKVPTQEFFQRDMGLPLTMTPNYEDFSCQFSFGKTPPPQDLDEAFATPCFQQCPSKAPRYSDGSRGSDAAGQANCPNIARH